MGSAERGAGRGGGWAWGGWFHIRWSRHLQMYMNGDSPCFTNKVDSLLSIETSNQSTFVCSVSPPRLSLLWNAGHGVRPYFRLPDHSVQSRGTGTDA